MNPRFVTQPTPPLGPDLLGTYPIRRIDDAQDRGELVDSALSDPATQVLVLDQGKVRTWQAEGGTRIAWATTDDADIVAYLGTSADQSPILLGRAPRTRPEDLQAGDPWPEDADPNAAVEDATDWLGLRDAAPVLPREESTWLSVGIALMNWHQSSSFCPSCGSPTHPEAAGWARVCDAEGRELFPRTDPAVISAVVHTDDDGVDRLLLGHSVAWPEDRYSTFAGFVEAGESLEAAVAREIREEAGVEIGEATYMGSQPWPFPRSLMVGFIARAESLDSAEPDGREISSVRWFTRDELEAAVVSGELRLPDRVSIAHHLIADWYGGPLPQPPERSEDSGTAGQGPTTDSEGATQR